jgi:hypothetical protein
MAHYLDRFAASNNNLGSWDLWDDDQKKYFQVEVTIESIFTDEYVGTMGKENKQFIKFKEYQKSMMYNKTNARRLQKAFNSLDDADYIGKKVVLGVEQVPDPAGGKGSKTDGLRFSSRAIEQVKALPSLSDADFPKAKASLEKGSTNIAKIQGAYTLTDAQLKDLQTVKSQS